MTFKAPLVFVPGLLCDADLWAHQIMSLSDIANIRVADTLADDNIGAMAARLLAEAPGRFALAGLSMGGYVALEVMRQAPDRVSHLALLSTSAEKDTSKKKQIRKGLIKLAGKGNFRGVTPRLLCMLVHESHLNDLVLCDRILKMAARVGRDCFIKQQRAIMMRKDSREVLINIKVPTLVLCGSQDLMTPAIKNKQIAEAIPRSDFFAIESCGHLPTMEHPKVVTSYMRNWLLTE